MRRNETVLVYAVTGLLIVILGVAVIFGEEAAPAKLPGVNGGSGRGLLDDLGGDADDSGLPGVSRVNPKAGETPQIGEKQLGGKQPGEPAKAGEAGKTGEAVKTGAGQEPGTQPPGTADDVAKKGAAVTDPNAPVTIALVVEPAVSATVRLLGVSRREGQYRVVTARRNDSLSILVERWCGNLDPLPTVEALNEDLKAGKPIPAGREVLVPWADDEVLLAAHKERQRKQADLEQKQGELYTLKKGDSLWKIAVQRVGSNKAPSYIRAIAERNPQLEDPDSVREGQKLRLPPVAVK